MNNFQLALLLGAVFTALISFREPRAVLWIALGAVSFVASTLYWRSGLPYAPAVNALCDTAMCFAVYLLARREWEKYLFLLFQGSMLVSLAYFVEWIGPHWLYVVVLEAINWLALLLIGATTVYGWIGDARGHYGRIGSHLLGARRLVWAPGRTSARE